VVVCFCAHTLARTPYTQNARMRCCCCCAPLGTHTEVFGTTPCQ
jgi:hypothetical protein